MALDLEIYNGKPTDSLSAFWWCILSPHFVWCGEFGEIHSRKTRSVYARGWEQVYMFPAFVERLRALALSLTFESFELVAEYEWPEGWRADGPI